MKNLKNLFFLILAIFIISACNNDSNPTGNSITPTGNPSDWLIPTNSVFNGGPGKDGIPSIDNPQFSSKEDIDALGILSNADLVIGIKVGDEIRAYPHPILDWHEIVNDNVNGLPVALTYCPLTGTAIGWKRTINGVETTFGVSGLLYNTNLIPYDRASDSNWSQMLLKSVNGSNINTDIETYPLVETTWGEWKFLFPDAKVLNTSSGFDRPYGIYPYGDYRENNSLLLFPIENEDGRLPRKERGLGVTVNNQSRFYRFNNFEATLVGTVNDNLNNKNIVVVGSKLRNFLVAYDREIEPGVVLTFEPIQEEGAVVMRDNNGDRWTIFGEAIEGPYLGQTLKPTSSFIGMWFAWATFHPDVEIFSN